MTLRLGRAVIDGLKRVFTKTGLVLFVLLLAIQFLAQTSINTAIHGLVPPAAAAELDDTLGLMLPISSQVALGLLLITVVLSSAYFVLLARALTRPMAELSSLPLTLLTHRIGRATVSMVLAGFIVAISVTIGMVFLILPGLFLATCFIFVQFVIGVEDRGPIQALKRSWGLSRGNRLRLFVLVVLAGVIGGIIGAVGSVFQLAGQPVIGDLVTVTVGTVQFILLYAVIAAAYRQVTDRSSSRGSNAEPTEMTADTAADASSEV